MDNYNYQKCLTLLREELIPAFGCTEPIAIAYAAAKARAGSGKTSGKNCGGLQR